MDLPLTFFVAAALATLLTGISKSGFGGGFGVLAVPLMALFVSPQFAAAVMMPILLAMDLLIVWRYRAEWERRIVFLLLPPALLGLVLGSLMFQRTDAYLIRLFVGALAVIFVMQFLLARRRVSRNKETSKPVVRALGLLSGFSSFIAHAGGPPVKGYLLMQRLEKSRFVATNTVYFFALNAIKSLAYGATGTLSPDSLTVSLFLAPLVPLGVLFGNRLHGVLKQEFFVSIVYGLLALAGAKLLFDGLSAYL